jgi:hypothetical protein
MEAVSSLFASGNFPVRFLRCTDAGEGRPRLVFELTKLTNIEGNGVSGAEYGEYGSKLPSFPTRFFFGDRISDINRRRIS